MQPTNQIDIEQATRRYAEALTADMLLKRRIEKNEVEKRKTHHEVVLAFQDLQALRYNN